MSKINWWNITDCKASTLRRTDGIHWLELRNQKIKTKPLKRNPIFALQYRSFWTPSSRFNWCYLSHTETVLEVILREVSVCCIRDCSRTAVSTSSLLFTSWRFYRFFSGLPKLLTEDPCGVYCVNFFIDRRVEK